jgi:branched-chain amino acid transport system permease protein
LGNSLGLPWLTGLSYFICVPIAALAAAGAGLLVGWPVLRLRGDYLAIVTLGFGEIVRIVITNNPGGITNGAAGLPPVGKSIVAPLGLQWLRENVSLSIPGIGQYGFNFNFTDNLYWYFIILLLVLFTIFVVRRINDSRLGRSWVAMREDEVAASSIGVNIPRAKLWAFTLSALWGGIAGVTFGNFQMFISPESFTFMESILLVCIVVLGGMGSIPGAILGAAVIQGVPELIRGLASSGVLNVGAETQAAISNYRYLVFGLLMVIMMAVKPEGLIPSQRRARELHPESDLRDRENQDLWEARHKTETDSKIL